MYFEDLVEILHPVHLILHWIDKKFGEFLNNDGWLSLVFFLSLLFVDLND